MVRSATFGEAGVRMMVRLVVLIAALVAVSVARAGETTTYRGDPAHLAAVDDPSIVPPFAVAWTRNLKTGFYATPPLVVDGRIFTANYGTLFALDAATGKTLWQQPVDTASFAGYGAGRVFTFGDSGVLRAFDAASGALLWSRQLGWNARSFPVVSGGRLYVEGGATLWQFDPETGADLWRAVPSETNEATPAVDGSIVIAADGMQDEAFAVGDGHRLWHFDSHSTGGGAETVAVHDGRVFSYDQAERHGNVNDEVTGALLRTFPGTEPPAIAGGLAIFPTADGTLLAQDEATGQTRWELPMATYLRTPFVVADIAYATYGPNGLLGVHVSDGSAAWCAHPTDQAGEVTAGDGILLWSAFGQLVAYRHDPSAPLPTGCPGNPPRPSDPGAPPASGPASASTPVTPASSDTSSVQGSGHSSQSSSTNATISGPGYRSSYPAFLRPGGRNGLFGRTLTSGPALDIVGIPRRPGIGLSIASLTTRQLRKALGHRPPTRLGALLHQLVGVPRAARRIHRSIPTAPTRVASAAAIKTGFAYTYRERAIAQRDILTRHRGHIVLIELDADHSKLPQASSALKTLIATWHWRTH
jgi:outer membrane protein assembly factor BamB